MPIGELAHTPLRSCSERAILHSWLRNSLHSPPTPIIMQLTKSFPPADDLVMQLQQIDYRKLLNDYMDFVVTVCAFVAAISTILWEKIQVMKFQTPEFMTDYFPPHFPPFVPPHFPGGGGGGQLPI